MEYIAEVIVIMGVVFEVLTDFEYILKGDEKKELRRRIEKFGAIILIFGLAIELGALARTNEISSLTVAALNKEAGLARKDATDANERAGSANKEAALANERSAELLEENQPRELSREQRAAMRNLADQFSDSDLIVRIASYRLDVEGARFSQDIQDAFGGKVFRSGTGRIMPLWREVGRIRIMNEPSSLESRQSSWAANAGSVNFIQGLELLADTDLAVRFRNRLKAILERDGGFSVRTQEPDLDELTRSGSGTANTVWIVVGFKPLKSAGKQSSP